MLKCTFLKLVAFMLFAASAIFAQTKQGEGGIKTADEIDAFFIKTRSVQEKTQLIDLVLPLEVNYKLNSAELTDLAREQLDNFATALLRPKNSDLKLELAGHTCDLGGDEYNKILSQKRLDSAFAYLKSTHGLDESRISTIAYGESLPVIANASNEEERKVNRRVVVYLPENRLLIETILRKNLKDPGFQWAVFHYTKNNKRVLLNYDGSAVLHSKDHYRVYMRPNKKKYVYIYQKDSHGKGEWLFPRADIDFKNPVSPGEYYLPHRSKAFVLDEKKGRETISILATDAPATELEEIISGTSTRTYSDAITQVVKMRGLKTTRIGAPPKGQNVQQGRIELSGQEVDSTNSVVTAEQENSIADIMTQYGEFYMELQFDHR